jgi:hypothetical protein
MKAGQEHQPPYPFNRVRRLSIWDTLHPMWTIDINTKKSFSWPH